MTVYKSDAADMKLQTLDMDMQLAMKVLQDRYESQPLAYVHSFGCQQNVSDGERIKGSLMALGFGLTDDLPNADLILFNTCAVRETAEDRVWGHLGTLKALKRANPGLIIAVCGCMMQQESAAEKIKKSYPYVDIIFGTNAIHMLPHLIYQCLTERGQVFYNNPDSLLVEGIPVRRDGSVKAYLPIMQGCNNFCSYCIVPHVRGREVSRKPGHIMAEAEAILKAGYREITLLGQNVNSYGRGTEGEPGFSGLLRKLDTLPGEYWLRFMTSHPKDCTHELMDTIAESAHLAKHIHLPVQSGSDRILSAMNRHYSAAHYLELIDYAKKCIPGVTFSSDIIVGFPGETEADFEQTLNLVRQVGYNTLFTFIYSRRSGTPAAEFDDPTPHNEKSARMQRLLDLQSSINASINESMVGETVKVLVEGVGKSSSRALMGRTEHTTIVEFEGPETLIGRFVDVNVEQARNWAVFGRLL